MVGRTLLARTSSDLVRLRLRTTRQAHIVPREPTLAGENDAFPYELRELLVGGKRRTYRAIFTVVDTEVRVLTVRRGAERDLVPGDLQ